MTQAGTPAGLNIGVDGGIQSGDHLARLDDLGQYLKRPPKEMMRVAITPDGVPVRVWNEEDMGDNEILGSSSSIILGGYDYVKGKYTKTFPNSKGLVDYAKPLYNKGRKAYQKWKGGQ